MKIVVAMMQRETNSFFSLPTPFESFAGAVGLPAPPTGGEAIRIYSRADLQ